MLQRAFVGFITVTKIESLSKESPGGGEDDGIHGGRQIWRSYFSLVLFFLVHHSLLTTRKLAMSSSGEISVGPMLCCCWYPSFSVYASLCDGSSVADCKPNMRCSSRQSLDSSLGSGFLFWLRIQKPQGDPRADRRGHIHELWPWGPAAALDRGNGHQTIIHQHECIQGTPGSGQLDRGKVTSHAHKSRGELGRLEPRGTKRILGQR